MHTDTRAHRHARTHTHTLTHTDRGSVRSFKMTPPTGTVTPIWKPDRVQRPTEERRETRTGSVRQRCGRNLVPVAPCLQIEIRRPETSCNWLNLIQSQLLPLTLDIDGDISTPSHSSQGAIRITCSHGSRDYSGGKPINPNVYPR